MLKLGCIAAGIEQTIVLRFANIDAGGDGKISLFLGEATRVREGRSGTCAFDATLGHPRLRRKSIVLAG